MAKDCDGACFPCCEGEPKKVIIQKEGTEPVFAEYCDKAIKYDQRNGYEITILSETPDSLNAPRI